MEAAIAASYIGTKDALDAMLDVLKHPRDGHLAYAITCSLGSRTLRPHWEGNPDIQRRQHPASQPTARRSINEPTPTASEAQFDSQPNLKIVNISCQPERMLFTVKQFAVTTGQPVKIVFTNPDATDHNLVVVKPDALAEVGMAANEMAKDPQNANSDFIPADEARSDPARLADDRPDAQVAGPRAALPRPGRAGHLSLTSAPSPATGS